MEKISEGEFEALRRWVKKHTAQDIAENKKYLMDTRLPSVIKAHELGSYAELIEALSNLREGGLFNAVVDALTTHESSFFRDFHPFEYLRTSFIPNHIKSNKDSKRIRIWSGACSSGQEIYSIAMIIREHFPELSNWDIELYATDISEPTLERARGGEYTQLEVSRGLPANYLLKYFQQGESGKWVLNEDIRRMVNFNHLNLADPSIELPTFDAIFLRNVLIYFDIEEKKRIVQRIKKCLNPQGILILGNSETTLNLDTDWYVCKDKGAVFYQLCSVKADCAA